MLFIDMRYILITILLLACQQTPVIGPLEESDPYIPIKPPEVIAVGETGFIVDYVVYPVEATVDSFWAVFEYVIAYIDTTIKVDSVWAIGYIYLLSPRQIEDKSVVYIAPNDSTWKFLDPVYGLHFSNKYWHYNRQLGVGFALAVKFKGELDKTVVHMLHFNNDSVTAYE